MEIEFEFNSIRMNPQEFLEQLPALLSALQSQSPPPKKKRKRRKRKKKETIGPLIQEIIADVES